MTPQELLTPAETAAILRISLGTLANWRTRHPCPLPFVKLGRLVRYRRDDVDSFGGLAVERVDAARARAPERTPVTPAVSKTTPAGR